MIVELDPLGSILSLCWPSGRPFINSLYWKFNGFDQAGHYSTTVNKRTFRNGIAGSVLFASCANLIPILVVTGATNIEQQEWNAGSLATAGTEIAGQWLGNWIVISAGISLLAQFFSEMAADSMGVQGLADRGHIPSIFRHQSRHNTPTVSQRVNFIIIVSEFSLIHECYLIFFRVSLSKSMQSCSVF